MSVRRKPSEIIKHDGKYYRLPPADLFTNYENPCCICDDLDCMDYDIMYTLDGKDWKHHIAECEMEDAQLDFEGLRIWATTPEFTRCQECNNILLAGQRCMRLECLENADIRKK